MTKLLSVMKEEETRRKRKGGRGEGEEEERERNPSRDTYFCRGRERGWRAVTENLVTRKRRPGET